MPSSRSAYTSPFAVARNETVEVCLLTLGHFCRSPRTSSSTPSSKTSRRASFDMSATASPTRATCGTMAPSRRYDSPACPPILLTHAPQLPTPGLELTFSSRRPGKTPTRSTPRRRRRVTTTRSTSARSASSSATPVRSSRSRSSVSWLCWTRRRPTGRSSSST